MRHTSKYTVATVLIETLISRKGSEVSEIFQVYFRAAWRKGIDESQYKLIE